MIGFLKRLAALLPPRAQQALKRRYFAWKIRRGRFGSQEPEYAILDQFLHEGDWALDIGANVGFYSARMSQLVGPKGRVIAFEPVRESFELLTANAQLFPYPNTTLLNIAVSNRPDILHLVVPEYPVGGKNYYEASVCPTEAGEPALALPVDALDIPHRVRLAKIDTEGHEVAVLRGMSKLLERDRPVVIVEANSKDVVGLMSDLGYAVERNPRSSNYLCRYDPSALDIRS